jgi:hypothetical protein
MISIYKMEVEKNMMTVKPGKRCKKNGDINLQSVDYINAVGCRLNPLFPQDDVPA